MARYFVGRARELDMFDEALAAAGGGTGRLVTVVGEAGIGKTRLCQEVAGRAERAGAVVAWGSCWPDTGAPPLWPWQAVLAELGDTSAVALLADDPGGPVVDPERFARFQAVADRVRRACAQAPALIIIDDAHAADAGALLLTRFIARHLNRLPLVLLLARRPGGPGGGTGTTGGASHAPLRDLESDAAVVTLRRFDPAETMAFLRSYGYSDVEAGLRDALWRLTGGNPLFLRRVVALGPADRAAGRLPSDDVKTAIAQAAAYLDGADRRILSRAAVLGSSPLSAEAVAVAGCTRADLAHALTEAERRGLVTLESARFSFTHELVRESLLDDLTVGEWCEAHAKAADALWQQHATADAPHLARLAHHAVHSAVRSTEDARRAIAACRAAATAMMRGFSYEQAAYALAKAIGVHERARLPYPIAALIVEQAQAVQMAGRLGEARRLFDRAAATAIAEGNPTELAKAALGLGGLWVNEHRTRPEWERVIGLQRRALAELPAGERRLRCRLTVRLAAEEVYQGGPVEPVLAAVDEARAIGDGGVLAEALSLCHHALLTPGHTRARLELADELIAVAAPAGEGMFALMGLCWRTVDLFHLGDPRAPRALAELREHADALNVRSVLYVAEVIETMLLIRAGRLAEAEAKAIAGYELGTEVGDADAIGYLGAHLVTIRWLQNRDAEMLATIEDIAGSPTLHPAEFAFRATVAGLAARAGRPDEARLVLGKLTAPGLADLRESSSWHAGMQTIAETAYIIGDPDLARQAYELLLPYADLPIMPSLAVTCLGSTERPLGLAALAFGDPGRAVDHLERAVTANRMLGNRPVTAIAQADLAGALLRRGHAGDQGRAAALLAEARREAAALGLTARAAEWQAVLDGLTTRHATIRRRDRHWLLALDDRQAIVPHRIGMTYLAHLLTNPGRAIPALQLAARSPAAAASLATSARQPVIDDQARAAYRRRAEELALELAEAERHADLGRAEGLRAELGALADELDRVSAKGGRTRAFSDPQERARTAVRKAIKRAIDEIAATDPVIGDVLLSSVTTGTTCSYAPGPRHPRRWSLGAAESTREVAGGECRSGTGSFV